ncbi:MAG: ABC transporter permease [Ruminococcus sp.]|nr:ABC transporter permease [Ruminococcus sp.]
MSAFTELVKRNIRIYLRDKGAVFFSLLSMFIVILLMVLFLGDMNISAITDMLSQLPDRNTEQDEKNAELLVLQWTLAGVISINAVSVTLSVLTSMIRDKNNGTLQSIYTSPVSRISIALSYICAAWISSVIICTLTLILGEIYCVFLGAEPFNVIENLQLFGMICVNSFTFACIMYLLAAIVKSEGAWSGLGTIIGTLVGFLGGIYLPIGSLAEGIANVLKCTPILYGTVMFRKIMTEQASDICFENAPAEMAEKYSDVMGITLEAFEHNVTITGCLTVLLICGIVFLLIGAAVTKYSGRKDR